MLVCDVKNWSANAIYEDLKFWNVHLIHIQTNTLVLKVIYLAEMCILFPLVHVYKA